MNIDQDGDRLLRALLSEELSFESEVVQARYRSDPLFARRCDELRALVAGLEEAGREQLDDMASRAPDDDSAHVAEITAQLRLWADPPRASTSTLPSVVGPRIPRLRLHWSILAAAAVLALAYFSHDDRLSPRRSQRVERMLSGAAPTVLLYPEPGGAYEAARGFAWSYDRAPGDLFEFMLEGQLASGEPFRTVITVQDSPWFPSPQLRSTWPRRSTWSVRIRAPTGEVSAHSAPRLVSFDSH